MQTTGRMYAVFSPDEYDMVTEHRLAARATHHAWSSEHRSNPPAVDRSHRRREINGIEGLHARTGADGEGPAFQQVSIVTKMKLVTFQTGCAVFAEGDDADAMFIVKCGSVKVSCTSKRRLSVGLRWQTVALLESGDFLMKNGP